MATFTRAVLWGAALLMPAAAMAKDKPHELPQVTPGAYQAVLDCRKIADSAARLACFDGAVATLATATTSHDVVVIDRATVRATKRGLFGLTLPSIKIFGGNDDEEVNQIESTLASASSGRDGLALFTLADGSRWKQTEGRETFAKAGQSVVIHKGALGSYMARIDGQPGVRVMRLQ